MKLKTKELTTCALFAALIAIGAFIKVDIPLPMYTMGTDGASAAAFIKPSES